MFKLISKVLFVGERYADRAVIHAHAEASKAEKKAGTTATQAIAQYRADEARLEKEIEEILKEAEGKEK